ncbi:MAG: hypothetical protein ABIP75_17080 [Pyrinomonadaceae bacterium]
MKLPTHLQKHDDIHESHADQLAPLEEQLAHPGPGGVHNVKIAKELIDGPGDANPFHLEPLVVAILLGAIAWILFLAYLTYHFVPKE